MGASRKLQGEINRVLKKVQEGTDLFDSIWNKVYDTDNANKYEADLNKEIKKLQRYRDQIKAWIQSSEIKDKKALLDACKQIEHEMERFKICEKETKAKAFSKEALGQQPKSDPREKAKSETRDWINNVVRELESQVDAFEVELEGLTVKKGKTRPHRLMHLEASITRHKAHKMKLELILRLLDNDELSPEQVNDVKDFLDDYLGRNQEDFDDFSDVNELYSSLPLEVEALEDLVAVGQPSHVKGSKPQGAAARFSAISLKNSLPSSSSHASAVIAPPQQIVSPLEYNSVDVGPKTPASDSDRKDSLEIMKDCCTIFFLLPKDYTFKEDTLIQLWMGGGYIEDEHMGQECLRLLLEAGCCFVRSKGVYGINIRNINDLLDGLNESGSSCWIWENEGQQNKGCAEIKHVSVVGVDVTESVFETLQQFRELRTLLFLCSCGYRIPQLPDNFFMSCRKVQTLDLSGTGIMRLSSLVCVMAHLRYLDLSGTLIEDLPRTIGFLSELQTLKLRNCYKLRKLPVELTLLTELRTLEFDVLLQFCFIPRGIGALRNLRTLSAFKVGTTVDGCKIQELSEMNNLTGDFCIGMLEHVDCAIEASDAALERKRNIKRLQLRWTYKCKTDNSYSVLENLQPCFSLEQLEIISYDGSKFAQWVGNPAFDQLVKISFYWCINVSELPPFDHLPSLKHLQMFEMHGVEKIERQGKSEEIAFPKLEKLEIDGMKCLKAWSWVKRNEGDFNSLVELSIDNCPQLQEFDVLPYLSSIKHMEMMECTKLQSLSSTKLPASLKSLRVEDCPVIQGRCSEKGGEDWYKIQHVPNKRISPQDEQSSQVGCLR